MLTIDKWKKRAHTDTHAQGRAHEKLDEISMSTKAQEKSKTKYWSDSQEPKTKWEFYLFRFIFFMIVHFCYCHYCCRHRCCCCYCCCLVLSDAVRYYVLLGLCVVFARSSPSSTEQSVLFHLAKSTALGERFGRYRFTGRNAVEQWIDLKHIEYDIFVKWSADADATAIREVI